MSVWMNPFFKMESRGRGPKSLTDARGWLLGRGKVMFFWRLLPLLAVAGSIALERVSLPDAHLVVIGQILSWTAPLVVSALAVMVTAAASTGREWKEGRTEEWQITPMERPILVSGKAWAWIVPAGAALTAGSILAAALWAVSRAAGWGVPLFVPLEGVLLVLECWAVLYLAAHLGMWAGNKTKRSNSALILSLILGIPLLLAVVVGLFFTVDLARLGGHLMVIGGAWLLGSIFAAWSERKLR